MILLSLLAMRAIAQTTISSTTAGGSATSPSTWIGGQVPGRGQQAVINGPVVLDTDWVAGVYGIVVDGGSFVSDGLPHTLSIGSYGDDAIGTACGGVVGKPGPCADMFGIVQTGDGGLVRLSEVQIVTPDGVSPIYTRNEVYGDHPSDFSLRNSSIQNLGTPIGANAYSGMVFATSSLPVLNVVVDNCTISGYYRLLFGGTALGVNSTLSWTNNRSEHESAMDLGSIVLTSEGFLHTNISNNTDWHPDGSGSYIYSDEMGFSPVVQEVHIQGGHYRRGLYQRVGGSQGTGNASIADDFCLNYVGSQGGVPCVSILDASPADRNTVIDGLVSTGNYETVQLRPRVGPNYQPSPNGIPNNNSTVFVKNSFLQEDWDVCRDQGIIMIGGRAPIVTNNILRLSSAAAGCANNIGFFAYLGTVNSILANNTIIGSIGNWTTGVFFGEAGFGVYDQRAYNNLVMDWNICITDNDYSPDHNTYSLTDGADAGVHHNATFNCIGDKYRYFGGAGFEWSNKPHPSTYPYGDLDGVDPTFVDSKLRDPFKYDAQFGGSGNGEWLFSHFAAGKLTTAQVRSWIFAGYAPTSARYFAGYGSYIGAVEPK